MAKFKRNNLQLKTNQKIQLGNNQETIVKYDGTDLKLTNDGGELSLDANGIALNSGVSINQFSNDPAMGLGSNIVPTQAAVKGYVEAQIGLGIETGNHALSTGDTTAAIVFVQQQGSSKYGLGYSIINTGDNPPLLFAHGVFERTIDGFKVMFSSPMDTDNYILSWIVTDAELGSSSSSSSSSSLSSSSSSSSSRSSSSSSSLSLTPAPNFTFLLHAADGASAEGIILGETSQVDFSGQGLSYIYRSCMQSDGRVVFPCYDGDGRVFVKCYEAGSLTVESWGTYITDSAYAYYSDIAILTNGNIVVAWGDYSTERAEFAILSPSGSIVQGMTNGIGTSDYNDDDYEVFIIPLEDGGFCLAWQDYYSTTTYASLWNANGTVRQARTVTENVEPQNFPVQMPSGGGSYFASQIPFFDSYNDYSWWYNVTDLTEEWDYEDIGYGGDYVTCAKLDTWTDRMALVAEYTGTVRGNVLKDDSTLIVDAKVILSGGYVSVNCFIPLPDGTFLLQATGASDYGLNYWILDENLDIVSGPTAAFTGITANNYTNVKGCAV